MHRRFASSVEIFRQYCHNVLFMRVSTSQALDYLSFQSCNERVSSSYPVLLLYFVVAYPKHHITKNDFSEFVLKEMTKEIYFSLCKYLKGDNYNALE